MIGGAQNKRGWRQINIGKPFFNIVVIASLLMGCGTLNESNKEEANTSEIKRRKENTKQIAEIIEEEKPYDRLNLIMIWLALLSSCSLVWCSIWFGWRWINK
jgi:hypothetical protein